MARKDDFEVFCNKFTPEMSDEGLKIYNNTDYPYQEALDKAGEGCKFLWTVIEGDSGKWYFVKGFRYINREGYVICSVPWKEDSRDYLYI